MACIARARKKRARRTTGRRYLRTSVAHVKKSGLLQIFDHGILNRTFSGVTTEASECVQEGSGHSDSRRETNLVRVGEYRSVLLFSKWIREVLLIRSICGTLMLSLTASLQDTQEHSPFQVVSYNMNPYPESPYMKELMQPNLRDFFHTQIAHATVFALIMSKLTLGASQ